MEKSLPKVVDYPEITIYSGAINLKEWLQVPLSIAIARHCEFMWIGRSLRVTKYDGTVWGWDIVDNQIIPLPDTNITALKMASDIKRGGCVFVPENKAATIRQICINAEKNFINPSITYPARPRYNRLEEFKQSGSC